jgi:N-methylhydantoinase B
MASPGYGDPLRPDPQAVLRDVRDGLVSPERDRSIYGVVITGYKRDLDKDATAALRC